MTTPRRGERRSHRRCGDTADTAGRGGPKHLQRLPDNSGRSTALPWGCQRRAHTADDARPLWSCRDRTLHRKEPCGGNRGYLHGNEALHLARDRHRCGVRRQRRTRSRQSLHGRRRGRHGPWHKVRQCSRQLRLLSRLFRLIRDDLLGDCNRLWLHHQRHFRILVRVLPLQLLLWRLTLEPWLRRRRRRQRGLDREVRRDRCPRRVPRRLPLQRRSGWTPLRGLHRKRRHSKKPRWLERSSLPSWPASCLRWQAQLESPILDQARGPGSISHRPRKIGRAHV